MEGGSVGDWEVRVVVIWGWVWGVELGFCFGYVRVFYFGGIFYVFLDSVVFLGFRFLV